MLESMLANKEEEIVLLSDQVYLQRQDFEELILNLTTQRNDQILISNNLKDINAQWEKEYGRLRKKVTNRNILGYGLAGALLVSLCLNVAQ